MHVPVGSVVEHTRFLLGIGVKKFFDQLIIKI